MSSLLPVPEELARRADEAKRDHSPELIDLLVAGSFEGDPLADGLVAAFKAMPGGAGLEDARRRAAARGRARSRTLPRSSTSYSLRHSSPRLGRPRPRRRRRPRLLAQRRSQPRPGADVRIARLRLPERPPHPTACRHGPAREDGAAAAAGDLALGRGRDQARSAASWRRRPAGDGAAAPGPRPGPQPPTRDARLGPWRVGRPDQRQRLAGDRDRRLHVDAAASAERPRGAILARGTGGDDAPVGLDRVADGGPRRSCIPRSYGEARDDHRGGADPR